MFAQVVVVYPGFYFIFMGYLFSSALRIDFTEGGIGGIGEDFVWEYDNVVIVFLCLLVV